MISVTVYVVAFTDGTFASGYKNSYSSRNVPLTSAKLYRKRGPATAALNASGMPGRVVTMTAVEVMLP